MRCTPCAGTGHLLFSLGHCALCRGTGTLSDVRLNNPRCVACHETGISSFRLSFCEICGGLGRLPSPPSPLPDVQALSASVARALESFKVAPKQIAEKRHMKLSGYPLDSADHYL